MNINKGEFREKSYVTVVGSTKVMLLSWVGQRLCYCRG